MFLRASRGSSELAEVPWQDRLEGPRFVDLFRCCTCRVEVRPVGW